MIKNITSKQTISGYAIGIGKKAAVSKGLDIAGEIISDDKITANAFYGKTGAELCPAGMSFEWSAPNVPTGYLLEDGAAKSRTTYADLFAVIGTTYGLGDGSTTFNVPDSRGRVAVCIKGSETEFDTMGKKGGHKLMQAHNHDIKLDDGRHLGYNTGGAEPNASAHVTWTSAGRCNTIISTSNGGGDSQNLQPYIIKRKIIKY